MTRREIILCMLAAGAGFIMMVYELVAARMLAPYVGSSTYVWTSVIGIIVAALSLGYWIGGRIADIRAQAMDVVLYFIAVAVGIVFTLQSFENMLPSITLMQIDIRLQAVIATLLLFAPVSIVVGMISPYLAKLNVRTLESSGRSVANLSAFNAIGGIVGTFITGFFLFNYTGIREIACGLIVMAVTLSWLIEPRKYLTQRAAASAVIVVLAILSFVGVQTKSIETTMGHYMIIEDKTYEGMVRSLANSPRGRQSGVYTENPDKLVFWYTQEMARQVDLRDKVDSILMLGGGAFTIPRYLADKYPDAHIDVVEIDPKLVEISREQFFYDDPPNVSVIAEDARTFLGRNTKQYDVVLVDVYGGDSIPYTFLTREYGKSVSRAVKPGGQVILNTIAGLSGQCKALFDATTAPYRAQFAYGNYRPRSIFEDSTNIIANFSDAPLKDDSYASFERDYGALYDDNYVPADRLYSACRDV